MCDLFNTGILYDKVSFLVGKWTDNIDSIGQDSLCSWKMDHNIRITVTDFSSRKLSRNAKRRQAMAIRKKCMTTFQRRTNNKRRIIDEYVVSRNRKRQEDGDRLGNTVAKRRAGSKSQTFWLEPLSYHRNLRSPNTNSAEVDVLEETDHMDDMPSTSAKMRKHHHPAIVYEILPSTSREVILEDDRSAQSSLDCSDLPSLTSSIMATRCSPSEQVCRPEKTLATRCLVNQSFLPKREVPRAIVRPRRRKQSLDDLNDTEELSSLKMRKLEDTSPLNTKPSTTKAVSQVVFESPPVLVSADGSEKVIPFFTNKYVFSNHFPCPGLTIDGRKFSCTEQYYMWKKAKYFKDWKCAESILESRDPKEIKQFGSNIENFDEQEWRKVSWTFLLEANLAKYKQFGALRHQLFRTAGGTLVEASPTDQWWGVGLEIDSADLLDRSKWNGSNLMGNILMDIRDYLMGRDAFSNEVDRARKCLLIHSP